MLAVIVINCLLAGWVCYLAVGLWKWRCQLLKLAAKLEQVSISPKQLGYAITLRRVHLAETRLGLAKLQQQSHRAQQFLRLLKLLRLLLLYRTLGFRKVGTRNLFR